MENSPGFECWLREHLSLDLAVDFSHVLLDVESVRTSTSCWAHKEFSCAILESIEFLWIFIELQVPLLLLLDAFLICLEVLHQVLDLLDFGLSIGVKNNSEILHQAEVCTHGISKSSELA